jgi:hypothetical protein
MSEALGHYWVVVHVRWLQPCLELPEYTSVNVMSKIFNINIRHQKLAFLSLQMETMFLRAFEHVLDVLHVTFVILFNNQDVMNVTDDSRDTLQDHIHASAYIVVI